MSNRQALAMLRQLDDRITVRWEPFIENVRRHNGEVLKAEIECANCHRTTPVSECHAQVIRGVHGDELPIPGYVHCNACVLRLDAKQAWVLADQEARQGPERKAAEERISDEGGGLSGPHDVPILTQEEADEIRKHGA